MKLELKASPMATQLFGELATPTIGELTFGNGVQLLIFKGTQPQLQVLYEGQQEIFEMKQNAQAWIFAIRLSMLTPETLAAGALQEWRAALISAVDHHPVYEELSVADGALDALRLWELAITRYDAKEINYHALKKVHSKWEDCVGDAAALICYDTDSRVRV